MIGGGRQRVWLNSLFDMQSSDQSVGDRCSHCSPPAAAKHRPCSVLLLQWRAIAIMLRVGLGASEAPLWREDDIGSN